MTLPELPDYWPRNYEHSVSVPVCFSFSLSLSLSHSPLIFLYFGALCLYDLDPTVQNVRGLCCLFSQVLELQTFRSTSFVSRSSFLVSSPAFFFFNYRYFLVFSFCRAFLTLLSPLPSLLSRSNVVITSSPKFLAETLPLS